MTFKRTWQKDVYSRLPFWIRRRLNPNKFFVVSVFLAGLFLIIFLITLFKSGGGTSRDGPDVKMQKKAVGRRPTFAEMHGVNKDFLGHYTPDVENKFRCLKTFKRIPFDQVNDDYCDCPLDDEASDEPSTGACQIQKFHCHGEEKAIPSNRVNDGICDCCDGTDEWKQLPLIQGISNELLLKLDKSVSPCPFKCQQ